MARPARLIAALLLAGLVAGCAQEHPEDPVVLTGAETPRLLGSSPGEVVAFRYAGGGWEQVPVQVDERDVVDLGRVRNLPPNGVTLLTYTDPGTFTGADSDTAVDTDDEVVFMGADSGARAPEGSAPAGVVASTGQEVRVADPVGDATTTYTYLFRRAAGSGLHQDAGRPYVDYRFRLLSGDYKTTYLTGNGANPEDSVVTTDAYQWRFSDRWISHSLRIKLGSATRADILDRHKNALVIGTCGRSEQTFTEGNGAFIANKSGPVRAIRSYIGANSGPLTQREHLFYGARQDITTSLRVHQVPGVADLFDYSPAASGMVYRNDNAPTGVRIDGEPDAVPAGELDWETVDGAQGGLTMVHRISTDIPGFASSSYYLDDRTPSTTQCTGDAFAYGTSGPHITQQIPNTDPLEGAARTLRSTRHMWFEVPGQANGPRRARHVDEPLAATAEPFGG